MPEITREHAREISDLLDLAVRDEALSDPQIDAARGYVEALRQAAGPEEPGFDARVILRMSTGPEVWVMGTSRNRWYCLDDMDESGRTWPELLTYGNGRMEITYPGRN